MLHPSVFLIGMLHGTTSNVVHTHIYI